MSAPGVVHVIGGSNCLIGNGWVAQWQAMMSDTTVVNLAVGGATSLVGSIAFLRMRCRMGRRSSGNTR